MKNGKKPISERVNYNAPIKADDIFGNALVINEDLKKHLTTSGLEWRFVDYKQLAANGGYHNRGWIAYNKEKHGQPDSMKGEAIFGADPSGHLRRASLILAVRPIATGDRHRAYNKQQAERQTSNQKNVAEDLRRLSGGKAKVLEGYEDNE